MNATPQQTARDAQQPAEESVAGEEDPGASIDLAVPPRGATHPGDEGPAGTAVPPRGATIIPATEGWPSG